LAKHVSPISFSPLQVTFLPLERIQKEIELGDIDTRPTSKAKCFHKRIMTYKLCKCATLDPQEIVIKHHQLVYKDFLLHPYFGQVWGEAQHLEKL
jgi:hypothetical protein